MSILTYRPEELCNQRKRVSDIKSDTEALTFTNKSRKSSKGTAYLSIRERQDDLELAAIESDAGYYDDLLN